jgi:hypothetical protein
VSTPRDADGEVIGFAMSKESPMLRMQLTPLSMVSRTSPDGIDSLRSSHGLKSASTQGLGLQNIGIEPDQEPTPSNNIPQDVGLGLPQPTKPTNDDDDLYFDDGLIDSPIGGNAPEFDESVFDNDDTDEYGRPLPSRSSLPTLYSPPQILTESVPLFDGTNEIDCDPRMSDDLQGLDLSISPKSQHPLAPHPSVSERLRSQDQSLHPGTSLTHDSLSAYQSALAAAANAAAANGRFRRDSSPTMYFDERDEHPDLSTTTHPTSDLPNNQPSPPSYDDDFDYDDALEDESIIAEANAEALANDADGFYGQEFGFYSTTNSLSTTNSAQYGGYFGPRGPNSTPAQNGRIVSREPNLTPITERSEYSNRNSIMSLPNLSAHGGHAVVAPLNSPGLAQLMNETDEPDLSFSSLLKLRKGAWGGSQASLRSSNGSPMSALGEDHTSGHSPVQHSPYLSSPLLVHNHARHVSGLSLGGQGGSGSEFGNSDVESLAPESPVLVMRAPERSHGGLGLVMGAAPTAGTKAVPTGAGALPLPSPKLVSSLNARPLSPTMKFSAAVGMVSPKDMDRAGENASALGSGLGIGTGLVGGAAVAEKKRHHRHTASADSISYMKEDDPVVGERWVLERRRTAESGEVEILGREVVSGGRI